METFNGIFHLLVWAAFCISCGVVEAFLFHSADYKKLESANFRYGDIHGYLNILRGVAMIGIIHPLFYIPALFIFPYLHDGAYYTFRNVMHNEVYPDRWNTYAANNTTAKISLNRPQRTGLFIAGVAITVITIIL